MVWVDESVHISAIEEPWYSKFCWTFFQNLEFALSLLLLTESVTSWTVVERCNHITHESSETFAERTKRSWYVSHSSQNTDASGGFSSIEVCWVPGIAGLVRSRYLRNYIFLSIEEVGYYLWEYFSDLINFQEHRIRRRIFSFLGLKKAKKK